MAKQPLKWIRHEDLAIAIERSVKRDEFLDHMTFTRNERPLLTEPFGPIVGLKEEWEAQRATASELDFSAFRYRCEKRHHIAVNAGRLVGQAPQCIKETDEYILTRDDLGRKLKLMKGVATVPLPLCFPVKCEEDWATIKPKYLFSEERFEAGWEESAKVAMDRGEVICVSIPGGYDEPRELMGEVELSYAYYEKPELIHDILETIGDTAHRVLDRVSQAVQIDLLSVHEDMAGKSGSLAGPKQIDEFIAPYYLKVWNMLRSRGVRLFDQDSDGDMNGVIASFLDAGINMMHPFEPAANMDIVEVRSRYGNRLAIYGGIDKHVVRRTREEIVAELEYKVPPMVRTGGCVLGLDHRIPNGTPLTNYRFYMEKVWEIMEREAAKL